MISGQEDVSTHVDRYEALRSNATARQSLVSRLGLIVLLQQGLAAWLEQWSTLPAPTPAKPAVYSRPTLLPGGCNADVINVLASMALSHLTEIHV